MSVFVFLIIFRILFLKNISSFQTQTMMFEVQDLAVASPATVSRCGMVYLEPRNIGLQPFINCWLKGLPESIEPYKDILNNLFSKFLEVKSLWS